MSRAWARPATPGEQSVGHEGAARALDPASARGPSPRALSIEVPMPVVAGPGPFGNERTSAPFARPAHRRPRKQLTHRIFVSAGSLPRRISASTRSTRAPSILTPHVAQAFPDAARHGKQAAAASSSASGTAGNPRRRRSTLSSGIAAPQRQHRQPRTSGAGRISISRKGVPRLTAAALGRLSSTGVQVARRASRDRSSWRRRSDAVLK